MDELIASGKPVTKENVKPIADKYYSQMFNSEGLLQDDAVKFATSEMALNIDTRMAGVLMTLQAYPAAKPFMMFNATAMNSIDIWVSMVLGHRGNVMSMSLLMYVLMTCWETKTVSINC